MELTQAEALGQSGAISTALNGAIDFGILENDLNSVYSLRSHFKGILKPGKTPGGKDGFSVDEVSIQNKF